jgi:hypothetical protein
MGILGLWDLGIWGFGGYGIMEKKRHKTKSVYIKNVCF